MAKREINNADYESIIPTALHTAYPLIFTDIPYSKEIFNELSKNGFDEKLKNPPTTSVYLIDAHKNRDGLVIDIKD